MSEWMDSDFLKLWQRAQDRLWRDLLESTQGFEFPKNMNPWLQPNINFLTALGESTIKQSLELHLRWLEQWTERVKLDDVSNDTYPNMIDQANKSLERWNQAQTDLWNYWFHTLDTSGYLPKNIKSTFQKNLMQWELSVKQVLSKQSSWLSNWEAHTKPQLMESEDLDYAAQQLTETAQDWIETQTRLWNYWFDLLNTEKQEFNQTAKNKNTRQSTATASKGKDDLKVISGIGPVLEKKLNEQGITCFQQIANLSKKEIEHLEKSVLKFPGRIQRENWVGQARILIGA